MYKSIKTKNLFSSKGNLIGFLTSANGSSKFLFILSQCKYGGSKNIQTTYFITSKHYKKSNHV